MTSHSEPGVLYVVSGVVLTLLGTLIVRYPEASYAIRTSWKHDDVSLSPRGRTDQRMMGAIVTFAGILLVVVGAL